MKHKKEWRTCDRCGKEIRVKPRTEIKYVRFGEYSDFQPYWEEDNIIAEIEETKKFKLLFPQKYELCPECRRDFERFMENEN